MSAYETNPLQIRRVKMDNFPNREDHVWILFRMGNIKNPVAVLDDLELEALLVSIEEQTEGRTR